MSQDLHNEVETFEEFMVNRGYAHRGEAERLRNHRPDWMMNYNNYNEYYNAWVERAIPVSDETLAIQVCSDISVLSHFSDFILDMAIISTRINTRYSVATSNEEILQLVKEMWTKIAFGDPNEEGISDNIRLLRLQNKINNQH